MNCVKHRVVHNLMQFATFMIPLLLGFTIYKDHILEYKCAKLFFCIYLLKVECSNIFCSKNFSDFF